MTPGARVAAAIDLLDLILDGRAAEQVLTGWARRNRYAGSGDRAAIRDLVFDALRCKRSFAALGGAETGRGLMIGRLRSLGDAPEDVFTGEGYGPACLSDAEAAWRADPGELPMAVRLDLPDWLVPDLRNSLGDDLDAVAEILRHRAPLGLRVNGQKADHAGADAALRQDEIESTTHPLAATARIVTRNPRRVRASRAYRDGIVELQDPASQAVVEALMPVPDGQRVLDYCAGGGGKALALAAATGAEIFAHDANPARMQDIPDRAARAGARITLLGSADVRDLAPWDLVLVDAPCSGSGAWRRQPEAKWSLDAEGLAGLQATQSGILEAAASLVAPGGRLAYATCSILAAENEDRIAAFLTGAGLGWRLEAQRSISPLEGGDGFYWAHLKRE